MDSIGEKIIQLKLYSRKAVLSADDKSKSAAGLKDLLLSLLLKKNLTPVEIMSSLLISKGNLTHLCASLIKEGLIVRIVSEKDRRAIEYRITKAGETLIKDKIECITKSFEGVLTSESDKAEASAHIDEVLRLMSFL